MSSPDPGADAKLVANEQRKITATFLNGVATASLAVGALGPLAAVFYGLASGPAPSPWFGFGIVTWTVAGVGLHSAARFVLRGLKS